MIKSKERQRIERVRGKCGTREGGYLCLNGVHGLNLQVGHGMCT